MIKRSIEIVAVPLMLALVACAGSADPQADLSAGYRDAEVEPYDTASQPLQTNWPGSPYPILSFEDREAIGRVTYAEAGNQGEEGIAAVIFTILNRVNSGQFGGSVQGVIDAPNQFEPATRAGGWRYLPPLDSQQSVQFETILNLILAGSLPDLTNGALFFQNARIVAARAARGTGSSYLVDFGGTPPVAEIGDHRFYDWRAAINLASRRYQAYDAETAYAADATAYEHGTGGVISAELGSDEVSPGLDEASPQPEPEPYSESAWDEQQPTPAAYANVVAAEAWDAGHCAAESTC